MSGIMKQPKQQQGRSASNGRAPSSSSSPSSPLLSPCLLSPIPTTLCIQLPDDRPYSALLRQSEVVYDQLLHERQRKLQRKIAERQQQYQEKYRQLVQSDSVKASEFERWAIAALSHLREDCVRELSILRQDYEAKFVKLRISLEEQWMAEHRPSTVRFQLPPTATASSSYAPTRHREQQLHQQQHMHLSSQR